MTSKSSFSEHVSLGTLMKENLKRRLWTIALSALGCIFAMPVYAALMSNIWMERMTGGWATTAEEIRISYFCQIMSLGNVPLMLLICGLALINGIQGMMYLHSRMQLDVYGALPVRRTKLFNACYFNGILIFAVPYILMYWLTVLFVKPGIGGLVTGPMYLYGAASVLIVIVFYTAIYSIVVLAAVLTGNTVVAIMGAGVLTLFGSLYYAALYWFKETFFVSWYAGYSYMSPTETLAYTSPVSALIFLVEETSKLIYGEEGIGFAEGILKFTMIYLPVSVVLYLICVKLAAIRPSEAAGRAMAFKKTKPFIKVFITLPAALLAALMFFNIGSTKAGWYIFGLAAGLLIAHAVTQIIYEFDFKACIKGLGSLAVAAVLAAAVSCIFIFDLFGYDTCIPEPEKVSSAGFASEGIHSRLEYNTAVIEPGSFHADYGWISPADYRLEKMELKGGDIETLNVIAKQGVEWMRNNRLKRIFGGQSDTEAEESGEGGKYFYSYVHYRLANGRDVYRSYPINYKDDEILEAFAKLYAAKEYKEAVYPELLRDNDEIGELCYNNVSTRERTVDPERERLLEVYREELYATDWETLKDEYPLGQLISRVYDAEGRFMDNQFYMYIYPSMTKTIGILKELGVDPDTVYDSGNIGHIDVYHYTENEDQNAAFDDAGEIKQIMDRAVYEEYYYLNAALHEGENEENTGYSIDAYYTDSPNTNSYGGYYSNSYIFDPDKEIPEFVLTRLEETP